MLNALKSKIACYLDGEITLQALREWFAPFSIDPDSSADPRFAGIAYELIGDFSDLDDKLLSEDDLRIILGSIADPRSPIEITLHFGHYSGPLIPSLRTAHGASSNWFPPKTVPA